MTVNSALSSADLFKTPADTKLGFMGSQGDTREHGSIRAPSIPGGKVEYYYSRQHNLEKLSVTTMMRVTRRTESCSASPHYEYSAEHAGHISLICWGVPMARAITEALSKRDAGVEGTDVLDWKSFETRDDSKKFGKTSTGLPTYQNLLFNDMGDCQRVEIGQFKKFGEVSKSLDETEGLVPLTYYFERDLSSRYHLPPIDNKTFGDKTLGEHEMAAIDLITGDLERRNGLSKPESARRATALVYMICSREFSARGNLGELLGSYK